MDAAAAKAFYEVIPALFKEAHRQHLFADGKVWADAMPKVSLDELSGRYSQWSTESGRSLESFIQEHFILPQGHDMAFSADRHAGVENHIRRLWKFLKREADHQYPGSSLLPLPHPYIVPGGRFNEIYYWDSYFTMLGLKVHGEYQVIQDMVDNFDWMIKSLGYIPNGNRSYFLGRSQPPYFSLMVALLAEIKGPEIWQQYLTSLMKEHQFWMRSDGEVSHLVGLNGAAFLNRYCDARSGPREEMYNDDLELAAGTSDHDLFYRHIRAACESGWDFSSRWLNDAGDLTTIVTADIIPVDLNCLLYGLELNISNALSLAGKTGEAGEYASLADRRRSLICLWLWNEKQQLFNDYNYKKQSHTGVISAACVYPLFFGIASSDQAGQVCRQVMDKLLKPGGIVTTVNHSGHQWDAPNGWAPLQWMTCEALNRYGYDNEARQIAGRWLTLNENVFQRTGKMLEKYNVEDLKLEGGGGEYPVQDGFGWTNGVYLTLKQKYGKG